MDEEPAGTAVISRPASGATAWSRGLGLEGWGVLLLSFACVALLGLSAPSVRSVVRGIADTWYVTPEVVPYLFLLWGLLLLAIDSVALRRRAGWVVAIVVAAMVCTTVVETMRWSPTGLRVLELIGATFFGAGVLGGTLLATAGRSGWAVQLQRLSAACVFVVLPLAQAMFWLLGDASGRDALESMDESSRDRLLLAFEWIPALAVVALAIFGALNAALLLQRVVRARLATTRSDGACCFACGYRLPPGRDDGRCPECGTERHLHADAGRAVDAMRADPAWCSLVRWGAVFAGVAFLAAGSNAIGRLGGHAIGLIRGGRRFGSLIPSGAQDVAIAVTALAAMTVVLLGWPATGARRIDGPQWFRWSAFGVWGAALLVTMGISGRQPVWIDLVESLAWSIVVLVPLLIAVLWLDRVFESARPDRSPLLCRCAVAGIGVAAVFDLAAKTILTAMLRTAGSTVSAAVATLTSESLYFACSMLSSFAMFVASAAAIVLAAFVRGHVRRDTREAVDA